jgi:hypothetical protein
MKCWNSLRDKYNVRAVMGVNGKNYEKYGTNFGVVLAVVDKTGPTTGTPVTGTVSRLEDAIDRLAGVREDFNNKAVTPEKTPEQAPVSTEENISRGNAAMDKVIAEHTDVRDAMYREDVGGISFLWGNKDTVKDGNKKVKPHGIAHAIDEHGEEAVRKLPEVLAKGELVKRYNEGIVDGDRADILYDGYEAHLALYKDGKRMTWIITGYKKEPPGATGEVSGSTGATPPVPNPRVNREVAESSPPPRDTGPLINGGGTTSSKEVTGDVYENSVSPKVSVSKKDIAELQAERAAAASGADMSLYESFLSAKTKKRQRTVPLYVRNEPYL